MTDEAFEIANQFSAAAISAPEAEQGVLGCVLLDPHGSLKAVREAGCFCDWFYEVRHRAIFAAIEDLTDSLEPVDTVSIVNILRGRGKLDDVGGVDYLATLPDRTPSAANLPYYLDLVREKYLRRCLADLGREFGSMARDETTAIADIAARLRPEIESVLAPDTRGTVGPWKSVEDLRGIDTKHDPNTLLGVTDKGITTRYMCKGGSGWIIGPSGVGKSSLAAQMAILWACGRDAWGIRPMRPLRITLVQAENDDGDLAEMIQGVLDGLNIDLDDEHVDLVRRNFRVRSESTRTGREFAAWLRRVAVEDRADIIFVDPLLSFAGVDVTKQDQCTQFLRTALNPVLKSTGVAIIGMHHTGKPRNDNGKNSRPLTPLEQAYSGIGSSELVNWARLVLTLVQAGDNAFELVLAKRGARAGASNIDGSPATHSIWLRHAYGKICWEQTEAPQQPEEGEESTEVEKGPSDLLPLVPVGGSINKSDLIRDARAKGFTKAGARETIERALEPGRNGEPPMLLEVTEKREGARPAKMITRNPNA